MKNKGFFKLLFTIVKVILFVVIALIAIIIITQRVTKNKTQFLGYGIYTIVSGSMVPEYNIYDMIIAKETDPADIMIGDDVVYEGAVDDFAGKIVTHRVISKTGNGTSYKFVTKGVANDVEDPEIDASQIKGKVIYKSIILSKLSAIVNNNYGFYFIVFIPIVIITFCEVVGTINDIKKDKESE